MSQMNSLILTPALFFSLNGMANHGHTVQSLLGLGFDPTENMHAMMGSTVQGHINSSDAAIDLLPSLSLDTPNGGLGDDKAIGVSKANNLFVSLGAPSTTTPGQFLGSSTWGTGGSLGATTLGGTPLGGLPLSVTNWDLLGTGSNAIIESSDKTSDDSFNNERKTASFLSLSSLGENTWGTGPISLRELGGASTLGSARSGAETSARKAD